MINDLSAKMALSVRFEIASAKCGTWCAIGDSFDYICIWHLVCKILIMALDVRDIEYGTWCTRHRRCNSITCMYEMVRIDTDMYMSYNASL